MEAVRSGGDMTKIGGDSKYTKTIVCPDGCVMFRLTAKPTGEEVSYMRLLERAIEKDQKCQK